MTRSFLMATAAAAAIATSSNAQQAFDLGELVLSPSPSPVPLSRVASTLEVLDEGDLVGSSSALADRLAFEPGVSASSRGGVGTQSSVQLRGLDQYYTGAEIDGIDVTDPTVTQTSFNFGGITGLGLGRVEVLKGPQSVVYGSDAIGGVVSMQSWRPETDGASGRARAEVGSFGTRAAAVSLGFRSDRVELAFSRDAIRTDGFSAQTGNTEKDGFDQDQTFLSARIAVTETLTFGANAFLRDSRLDYDFGPTDPVGTVDRQERGQRMFAELETGALTHRLSVARFDTDRYVVNSFGPSSFEGDREVIEYVATFSTGRDLDADLGVSRTTETAETTFFTRQDQQTDSLFGELRWAPGDTLDVGLALRRDDTDVFGGQTTGRLTLSYAIGQDTTVRAVAATGYRAPSLFELYDPTSGDPTFVPETSRSLEFGVERSFGAGSVSATLFANEIDDAILFNSATFAYEQVGDTLLSRGIELSGRYAISDALALSGSYTLADTTSNGVQRPNTPRHDLVLGLDATLTQGIGVSASVRRAIDIRPDEFAPAGNKVGDFTVVNLEGTYSFTEGRDVYLRIENALDEDYETVGGYNTPGQSVFAGVRASF